jgi:hypothetical protein
MRREAMASLDMTALASQFIGTLRITLERSYQIGDTPAGWRRFDAFRGGGLEGPRVKATLVHGSDSILRRADGSLQPDVRLLLETDDAALILVTYRGVRHGTQDVMDRIARGDPVPAGDYYLRASMFFETGAAQYDWLNRIVAVGVGRREAAAAVYEIHEVT